jgi:hypothetical protein
MKQSLSSVNGEAVVCLLCCVEQDGRLCESLIPSPAFTTAPNTKYGTLVNSIKVYGAAVTLSFSVLKWSVGLHGFLVHNYYHILLLSREMRWKYYVGTVKMVYYAMEK